MAGVTSRSVSFAPAAAPAAVPGATTSYALPHAQMQGLAAEAAAALAGTRGPPHVMAALGASAYRAEVQRPYSAAAGAHGAGAATAGGMAGGASSMATGGGMGGTVSSGAAAGYGYGSHAKAQRLQLDPSPVKLDGRGATPWIEAQAQPTAPTAVQRAARAGEHDVLSVLRDAEHTLNVMSPVVHHDLREIAAKKTAELLERDKLVRVTRYARGLPTLSCAVRVKST